MQSVCLGSHYSEIADHGIVGKLALVTAAPDAVTKSPTSIPEIALHGAIETCGPINVENVRRAVAAVDTRQGLRVSLKSAGGNVDEAMRVYAFLRSLPIPISARVDESCVSSAMLIWLAAGHRVASAKAELMIHATRRPRDTLHQEFYTAADLCKLAKDLADLDDECCALMSDRTGHPQEWFTSNFGNEDSLSFTEALYSGLVHEIEDLTPRCTVAWAQTAQALGRRRDVYIEERYLSPNYFNACVTADSLRESEALTATEISHKVDADG